MSSGSPSECKHWFIKYPPFIGKFRTCLRCGATKIGRGTSTITDNYWEHTVAAAPANPSAGLVRVYTPSGRAVTVRDSAGATSDLATGLTRAGGNTTEATTTSTTSVSLIATSSLSITTGIPVHAMCMLRKTTGAAATASVGFMVNAVELTAPVAWTNADNAAYVGSSSARFQSAANVEYTGGGRFERGGQGQPATITELANANLIPVATLTSVTFRALVGSASITMGADEMQVYTYAVA